MTDLDFSVLPVTLKHKINGDTIVLESFANGMFTTQYQVHTTEMTISRQYFLDRFEIDYYLNCGFEVVKTSVETPKAELDCTCPSHLLLWGCQCEYSKRNKKETFAV